MKRSTRSLTAIVERPARSSPSSISKTEASNRPDSRISASSAGVLTMSGDGRIREPDLRRGELHPDDLVEGQGRMGFGEHSRSEEHTSELQSLMRISYAVFCF